MTRRLEEAIKQLPADKLESLTDYAEFLAIQNRRRAVAVPAAFSDMSWAGAAADLGQKYADGVEAAHDAARMWGESAERSLKG
jgi:hypothetical protein